MARLLMISGDRSLSGGKRGAFFNTLEEFHKHWDRVDIICPKARSDKSRSWSDRGSSTKSGRQTTKELFGNVFIHPSPWSILFQPLWIWYKGRQLFNTFHFSLFTCHEYPPFYNGLGARWLHRATGVPYILEIMHIPGWPRAGNLKEKFYAWFTRIYIRYDVRPSDAVRVINQKEVPEFLKCAGVPAEKIRYIPASYINLDVFHPEETHKEYDLVYVARLEKNKGIQELLAALTLIKRSLPGIRLLIVGNGTLKGSLEWSVLNHGLKNNVSFSGWLPDSKAVADAYRSARVFVSPSYNEGGPRVVLEAMACGLPVITTRVGAMHDLIIDGENGLFTDWEPERMAQVIIRLLRDVSLQEKFSHSGPLITKQFERRTAIAAYADGLKHIAGI